MYTWGQLKTELRGILWPQGEAFNLVTAHDKFFLDAIMDVQRWVDCAKQDQTDLVPQCATYYKCGITVCDAPRGNIVGVSVIDKINPSTGLEDPTQPDEWCSEIQYRQIDPCYVNAYWRASLHRKCCLPIGMYFGFPCHKANFPIPTDEGLPPGLPFLPLGYHYPQASTDRSWGRATHGRWAIERGKLYIIPWIQSTETIIIKWDGIKRVWGDGDPIDNDPDLLTAIMEYVRWQHMDKFEKDEAEMARATGAYTAAIQKLIHECIEETRVRECESSKARFSTPTLQTLYYNDSPQTATADCPAGTTGNSATVTIPPGTVSSTVSISDANAKALAQAQSQAQAQLVCTPVQATYTNSIAGQFTASCQGDESHPAPTGSPVTVIVPIGSVTSTVSVADANTQAQALAQERAQAQLVCVYWNKQITVNNVCPTNPNIVGTGTVAAKTYSASDQATADQLATNDANNQANASLQSQGCSGGTVYWNTIQSANVTMSSGGCSVSVTVTVPAHSQSSTISQADANQTAINVANAFAQNYARQFLLSNHCGVFTSIWPALPS